MNDATLHPPAGAPNVVKLLAPGVTLAFVDPGTRTTTNPGPPLLPEEFPVSSLVPPPPPPVFAPPFVPGELPVPP